MPPDLALLSILIGSNYPCLELIFMVPKVFQPLKFDCSYIEVNMNFVLEFCEYPLHNVCNICANKLTSATDYKYLSWVYGVDREICHEGHCSASRGLLSDAENSDPE